MESESGCGAIEEAASDRQRELAPGRKVDEEGKQEIAKGSRAGVWDSKRD